MTTTRRLRWYQEDLMRFLLGGGLRAIEVAHRRWGKDEMALSFAAEAMKRVPGNYWHCLPEYAQARKAIWDQVNRHTGKRRIDEAFPLHWRKRTVDNEMKIELKNGSIWQVIGSDNYNALVGAGIAGCTFSEWALCNPDAWGYIRPMLVETKGWALFITTPRGRNHAKALFDYAKKHPEEWFAELQTIYDTGELSEAEIAKAKAEMVALYGEDIGNAQFEQEYECNWNAAVLGAFYAREMARVRSDGRVVADLAFDRTKPVHTAWDLGVRDSTAIWWWQAHGRELRILDYYAAHNATVEHFAPIIRERAQTRGWTAGIDYVPHDARVKEWGAGRTRVETMIVEHQLKPSVVGRTSDADGHQAIRWTLPWCIFDERCEVGLQALELYRREWDTDLKTFKPKALHDWASHGAKAFQYLAQAWIGESAQDAPVPGPDFKALPELTVDEFIEMSDDTGRDRRI